MEFSWQLIVDGFAQMSRWEIVASVLGLGYIIYAARESQWCWPMAFVSTLIYTILFWKGQLPMQAILNFYYMGMAVYGFWAWRQHKRVTEDLAITSWSLPKQLLFIISGTALSTLTAYYLQVNEASQRPYLDAFITVFSVMNTWLMARKIIQNWLYWIIIDAAAVYLYFETAYYATMVLFALYIVLAANGYRSWRKLIKKHYI